MGTVHCSVHHSLALGWMLLAVATHAHPPEVVSTFASAPPNGKYAFASGTPKTLPDLLKGNTTGESVNIVGHLFLPPGSDKVPAVVLVHGSGGIYNAELDFWPKQFNAAGIAVFTLECSAREACKAPSRTSRRCRSPQTWPTRLPRAGYWRRPRIDLRASRSWDLARRRPATLCASV